MCVCVCVCLSLSFALILSLFLPSFCFSGTHKNALPSLGLPLKLYDEEIDARCQHQKPTK
eukprot:m.244977 g.244977  ORF g.244977 m.244977 type:complete len:60 (+) comp26633_c2_seq1:14-193(+)